jgi:cell division protein FtsL
MANRNQEKFSDSFNRIYPDHWVMDKKIPVALLFVILLQTLGVVWWAATITGRLDWVEKGQLANSGLTERVVRLEVLGEQNKAALDRIEKKIDEMLK